MERELMGRTFRENIANEWRKGQIAYNFVYLANPELARDIIGTDKDPFYRDENLDRFWNWVQSQVAPWKEDREAKEEES